MLQSRIVKKDHIDGEPLDAIDYAILEEIKKNNEEEEDGESLTESEFEYLKEREKMRQKGGEDKIDTAIEQTEKRLRDAEIYSRDEIAAICAYKREILRQDYKS